MNVQISAAAPEDRARLGALFELYAYDFSEILGLDVGDDGRFRAPALDAYWTDPRRHAFLIRVDERLAGFALVQERSRLTGKEAVCDVAEFFVMRRYRRHGIGDRAARWLFDWFRGRWEVRQKAENEAATAFWRRVIDSVLGRAVRGRGVGRRAVARPGAALRQRGRPAGGTSVIDDEPKLGADAHRGRDEVSAGRRSALVLPVPEADALVGRLRLAHDPSARAGMGAHMTLLYPFLPAAQIDDGVLARLEEQLGHAGAVELLFDRLARFPGVSYLALADTEAVSSKIRALAAAWPECPPYEGRFADVVPHLTVAYGDDLLLDAIEAELAPALPLLVPARTAMLAVEDAVGRWRERARFALDADGG